MGRNIMNEKYYKPSERFSVTGLILMIVCTALAGMAISFVYLKLNSVCPVVYLCILMAALYGAAMGGVAYFFIKTFKLRSPKMVIVSLCIALLFTTFFKWALYDHFDRQDQYDYISKDLTDSLDETNQQFASMGVDIDLDEPVFDVLDDFMSELTKSFGGDASQATKISDTFKSKEMIDSLKSACKEFSSLPGTDYKKYINSSDSEEGGASGLGSSLLGGGTGASMVGGLASDFVGGDEGMEYYAEYYLERHPDASLWETLGMAALLGKDEDAVEESINKLGELSIREYLLEYHGEEMLDYMGYKNRASVINLMTHPGKLITDIKDINAEGRWSYSSSHSYSSSSKADKEPVHGFILWLVWIGELLVINAPAFLIAIPMCQRPFIESDNDWAIRHNTQFKFGAVNAQALKSSMEAEPMSLFNNQALITAGGRTNYFTVTLFHSRSYMENYVLVDNTTYDARRKTYNHKNFINYMAVTPEFVGTLFTIFGLNPPVGCHPDPMYTPGGFSTSYVPQGTSITEQNKAAEAASYAQQRQQPMQQPMQQPAQPVQPAPTLTSPYAPPQQQAQPVQSAQPQQGGSLLGGSLFGGGQPTPTIVPQPARNIDADSIFGEQQIIQKPKEGEAQGGINLLTGKPKDEDKPLVADSSGTSGFMDGLDTSNLDLDNFDFK